MRASAWPLQLAIIFHKNITIFTQTKKFWGKRVCVQGGLTTSAECAPKYITKGKNNIHKTKPGRNEFLCKEVRDHFN
jgi:hypothetical protein